MKFWDEYIAYLKDNPKGYWFKRKCYGYGWTPARPAGWAVVVAYVLFVLGVALYAEYSGGIEMQSEKVVAAVVAATLLLVAVSWKTGEPPRWQWGGKPEDE